MQLDTSEVGILISSCTKDQIEEIRKLRAMGYPYKTIGAKMDMSVQRVARFDRVFDKFGIDVFADGRWPRGSNVRSRDGKQEHKRNDVYTRRIY